MSDPGLSRLIKEGGKLLEKKGKTHMKDLSGFSPIHVTFSPQAMRKCSVVPESSASKLKRSISNTVERKPAESIDLHQVKSSVLISAI